MYFICTFCWIHERSNGKAHSKLSTLFFVIPFRLVWFGFPCRSVLFRSVRMLSLSYLQVHTSTCTNNKVSVKVLFGCVILDLMYGSLSRENLLSTRICLHTISKPPGRKKWDQMKRNPTRNISRARKVGNEWILLPVIALCFCHCCLLGFAFVYIRCMHACMLSLYYIWERVVRMFGFRSESGCFAKDFRTFLFYFFFVPTEQNRAKPSKYCHSTNLKWILVRQSNVITPTKEREQTS